MMKKRYLALLLIPMLIAVMFADFGKYSIIQIAFCADSYGNDINYVEVWQWNGSAYVLKHNFTSSGGSTRVNDGQVVKFVVSIKLNDTLASSNTEAVDYTKVLMNITDGGSIWTNEELNNTAVSSSGGFYWLKEEGIWNQTGYPQAGVTYTCDILYQAYY